MKNQNQNQNQNQRGDGLARRALLIVTLKRCVRAAAARIHLSSLGNEKRTQAHIRRNLGARASAYVAHAGRLLRARSDRYHLPVSIECELAAASGRQTCITDCSAHFYTYATN
jgi:hypothetical protein